MNFLAFALIIVLTIVVASFITNMLRGIIIMLAISSISFYLFVANPEQKLMMDNFSKNVTFSNSSIYVEMITDKINSLLAMVGLSGGIPSSLPKIPGFPTAGN